MKKILTLIFSLALLLSCAVSGVLNAPAKAQAATEGNVAVNAGYTAGDQCFYYKTTFSGAITVEYDVAFGCFQETVFGFGLTPDGTESNPYSSGLFFANSQSIYTPWRAASGIASPTAYTNYDENYWGVKMYFRVRIKMEVNSNGDVDLYAKSIESQSSYGGSNAQTTDYVRIAETVNGLYATELAGETYSLGFFFRNGSANGETMKFYGFKVVKADGTTVEERLGNENMSDNFWTGAIESALADKTLVYTQQKADVEKIELKISGTPAFEQNDGYGLPYLYFITNSRAAQWTELKDQLANVEYKRADGAVETLNSVVVIDNEGKVQIRLAASGTWELKEGDTFTVKKGFTLLNDGDRLEKLEEDVSFVYSAESGSFITAEEYHADKRGAMLIKPAYPDDSIINYNARINGACSVYIELDMSAVSVFGVGFMSKTGDSNPYSSKLFFMTATQIYTPWATRFMPSLTNYKNNFTLAATTLKISVGESGDTAVYALVGENYVQIVDTIEGMYKDEASGGMYLSLFARANNSTGYIYKISVADKNDKLLAKTDFAYDKVNADTFTFSGVLGADVAGEKKMISWQKPTGKYIPVPEVEILTGNIESIIIEGSEINLVPTVNNLADTDVLGITVVCGETQTTVENGSYKFETAGVYTVKYVVTGEDGLVKASDEKTIVVNVPSTQPTVMTNFNQGFYDAENFEAVGKAGVADGALLIKTDDKASFMTKGYSESFILTFDIVKYVSGEISLVLGKINDNAYIVTFNADGSVSMGEQRYNLPVNIYDVLAENKTVTVRVKLSAKTAEIYLRAEGTSVENIDIAVARFTDIIITGKVGVTAETASEFAIDNFRFVSLTSVKGDNTGDSEPESGSTSDSASDTSGGSSSGTSGSENSGSCGSCNGAVAAVPVLALAGVAAIAIFRKRKQD